MLALLHIIVLACVHVRSSSTAAPLTRPLQSPCPYCTASSEGTTWSAPTSWYGRSSMDSRTNLMFGGSPPCSMRVLCTCLPADPVPADGGWPADYHLCEGDPDALGLLCRCPGPVLQGRPVLPDVAAWLVQNRHSQHSLLNRWAQVVMPLQFSHLQATVSEGLTSASPRSFRTTCTA